MADYIVPRVQIEQEFTQSPVFAEQPLAALVLGPQYKLSRYAVAAEKANTAVTHPSDSTLVNAYQANNDVTYDYTAKVAGSTVDLDYVKVNFEKIEALYFPNTTLGTVSAAVVRVAIPNTSSYYKNRVLAGINLKTANSTSRNAVFSNRDVSVGDIVILSNGTATSKSKIKSLLPTITASAHGTVTNDIGNKATLTMDVNDVPTFAGTGATTNITINNTSSSWQGYPNLGIASDVFTVEVTTGGTVLANLRFKISSANGSFATKTGVALNNLDELFIDSNDDVGFEQDVKVDFTGSTGTFLTTHKWTLPVRAAVTQVTPTASGTYTGAKDVTYKLTVVRGGPLYDNTNADICARVAVTSSDIDSSPAVNVKAATAFDIGTAGLKASFAGGSTGTSLILGDVYYVPATAEAPGAVRTIELQDEIGSAVYTTLAAAGSVTMSLYLPKTVVEIPRIRDLVTETTNWDATSDDITIHSNITVSDSLLVVGADLVPLNVNAANIYVERRELLIDNTASVGSISSTGEVEAKLGVIHPDNPLAQGVYDAVLNSADTIVYFAGVVSDDLEGYITALELAKKTGAYYNVAPMTFDRTVQDAIVGHVNSMSTSINAKWRVAWLSVPLITSTLLYDLKSNGNNWEATVVDDPTVTGTQYTLVSIPGAKLISDGVRIGDRLLINYRLNVDGVVVNDEYVINEIRTETTCTLSTGLAAAVNSLAKVQIKRIYTKDEQIDALASAGGDFNNRRVRVIFPSQFKSGSVVKSGFYLAAALGGLASGVVPHQGLTNIELLGPTDLSQSVSEFTEEQLNRLAAAGIWIVTQSTIGATAYNRHQLTTDESGLNFSEHSITANVDSIAKALQKRLDPIIGKYNTNAGTLLKVRSEIDNELRFRAVGTETERAGNQLNSYEILSVARDTVFKDRITSKIKLDVPAPTNNVTIILEV